MKEFFQAELAKVRECKMLFDQSKQLASNELNGLSSRVGDESNHKEILEPPPRIPGAVSPYNAKVTVPDEMRTSRRSKDSRLKSGKDSSNRMKSARSKKISCIADGVAVRSSKQSKVSSKDPSMVPNIIEEDRGIHRSRQ
jgi:hypothetical protein